MRSTNHEILRYAVISSPLLPRSSYGPNIFLSTLLANTLRLYPSLNVTDQISYHTKQQAILESCRLLSLYFWIANWRQKFCTRIRASIPWVQSSPSFFKEALFIFYNSSQTFDLLLTFKDLLSVCNLWRCPVICLSGMNI